MFLIFVATIVCYGTKLCKTTQKLIFIFELVVVGGEGAEDGGPHLPAGAQAEGQHFKETASREVPKTMAMVYFYVILLRDQ